jgi:hypothetical protein
MFSIRLACALAAATFSTQAFAAVPCSGCMPPQGGTIVVKGKAPPAPVYGTMDGGGMLDRMRRIVDETVAREEDELRRMQAHVVVPDGVPAQHPGHCDSDCCVHDKAFERADPVPHGRIN